MSSMALTEEGRLLIELFNPSVKMLAREAERRYPVGQYEAPKAESQVFVIEEMHFGAASQINHTQWFFRNSCLLRVIRSKVESVAFQVDV